MDNCKTASPTHQALLKHQRSTFGLLVTARKASTSASLIPSPKKLETNSSYPNSKCLHRFRANCALVLQTVHSNLKTTFFVVLAFL